MLKLLQAFRSISLLPSGLHQIQYSRYGFFFLFVSLIVQRLLHETDEFFLKTGCYLFGLLQVKYFGFG